MNALEEFSSYWRKHGERGSFLKLVQLANAAKESDPAYVEAVLQQFKMSKAPQARSSGSETK